MTDFKEYVDGRIVLMRCESKYGVPYRLIAERKEDCWELTKQKRHRKVGWEDVGESGSLTDGGEYDPVGGHTQ